MLVTLEGMVTLVRPEQTENAEEPMLVTPSGMVTLVRPERPCNAEEPMLVTVYPFMVEGINTSPVVWEDVVIVASDPLTS